MAHLPAYAMWIADTMQNTYLISINVTNKQKEMYYHEYVPELLDVSTTTNMLANR